MKSATCDWKQNLIFEDISIHAPMKSATFLFWLKTGGKSYFNPRTHEECDVPARRYHELGFNFNPRTHEECDGSFAFSTRATDHFNPRTHEECDSDFVPN